MNAGVPQRVTGSSSGYVAEADAEPVHPTSAVSYQTQMGLFYKHSQHLHLR